MVCIYEARLAVAWDRKLQYYYIYNLIIFGIASISCIFIIMEGKVLTTY